MVLLRTNGIERITLFVAAFALVYPTVPADMIGFWPRGGGRRIASTASRRLN